jgi:hypothetical protein
MSTLDQQLPTDAQGKLATDSGVRHQGAENALIEVRKLQGKGVSDGKTGAASVVAKDGTVTLSDPFDKSVDKTSQKGFPGKTGDENSAGTPIEGTPPPPVPGDKPPQTAPPTPASTDVPNPPQVPKQGDTSPVADCQPTPQAVKLPSGEKGPNPENGPGAKKPAATIDDTGTTSTKRVISTPDTPAPPAPPDQPGSDSRGHHGGGGGGRGGAHHIPDGYRQSTPPLLIPN